METNWDLFIADLETDCLYILRRKNNGNTFTVSNTTQCFDLQQLVGFTSDLRRSQDF